MEKPTPLRGFRLAENVGNVPSRASTDAPMLFPSNTILGQPPTSVFRVPRLGLVPIQILTVSPIFANEIMLGFARSYPDSTNIPAPMVDPPDVALAATMASDVS